MGLSLSSTKLPHAPLSFRAFCGGGGNATLGVPAKRKRALLRSNLPRNSRPETNHDAAVRIGSARLLGSGPILSLGLKPWVATGHRYLGSSWHYVASREQRQTCGS